MTRVAFVLLPVVFTFGLSGCSTPDSVEPTTIHLDITASAPADPREEDVELGSSVTLEVSSEVDGLLHVHGFEEKLDLVAGGSVETTFKASMTGVFEVETHVPDAVWIKLVVS